MTSNRIARGLVFTLWLGASAGMLAQSGSVTYNPAAEVTVSGKILHLASFPAADGGVGVHFDLQTAAGMLNIHVAPAMFIGQSNFWFYADSDVEIVAVKVALDGNKYFIARAVTKDGKTLTLRGSDGKPAWTPASEGVDGCGVNHLGVPRGTEL
jgi:hypothetical protein